MAHPTAKPVKLRRTTTEAAESYVKSRDPKAYRRTAQEEAIVRAWLQELPKGATVFDCPCGVGRFVKTAEALGLRYLGGDVAQPMVVQARRLESPAVVGFVVCDAEHLPLADNSVDCTILWRLLHHIPDAAVRQRMLSEAGRVARRMVLVSFHHPISFTFLRRLVKRVFTNDWEISDITQWRLAREAAGAGLELSETRSFGKYTSINWFACLRKRD